MQLIAAVVVTMLDREVFYAHRKRLPKSPCVIQAGTH